MGMGIVRLQELIGTEIDGRWGPNSKAALLAHFTNRQAPALERQDVLAVAQRLGASERQVRAFLAVEARGRGYDSAGLPKILFERHKFHRYTAGKWSPRWFSQGAAGGYTIDADKDGINDSWEKLSDAVATGEVDAAFMACSWGIGQVMGEWWDELGYISPYALAWTCAQSEADQLELVVRYIEHFRLQDELRDLTGNPDTCRPFAAAYNGPGYRRNAYHEKLAEAMRNLPG